MILLTIALLACLFALIPALLFHRNLRLYLPPPAVQAGPHPPALSVLIPARNEEKTIQASVAAALASEGVTVEIIVLDDHSTDATASIVKEMAALEPRLRLVAAPPLPPGWCGKQHACAHLAEQASHDQLVFVDADVRLAPTGLARMSAFLERHQVDLASGIPCQEMGTFGERLIIPLIHVLLLGFLPIQRMRSSLHPAYGSGCGQLFIARRDAYHASGGHAAIRASLHDGITLPRAFRTAGYMTDLFDATDIATCRMYQGFKAVWNGLAKNATEGLATTSMIVPATVLLLGGHVLPLVLLLSGASGYTLGLASIGVLAAYYPRWRGLKRFRQPGLEAVLHPVGVMVVVAIQWYAYWRARRGQPATWKDRPYFMERST